MKRVTSRLGGSALLALLAVVMATSPALGAWNPSIVLRPATFIPWSPDLAASGAHVVAAWSQAGNPDSVWVRRSTNSGGSFGAPARLAMNNANAAHGIRVFSGAGGHLAVWSELVAGGGSRVFMSRAPFFGAWSAATQVSSNPGTSHAIEARIVQSGNILVVAYQVSTTTAGPFSVHTRVKVGNAGWGGASVLPGGALQEGSLSVAASASRVLVVWTNASGQLRQRRGAITNSGTSFAWFAGYLSLGSGGGPLVVLSGTRAVILSRQNADIYRRLSSSSGSSYGPSVKVLDGFEGDPDVDASSPYNLDDAAMNGARVVFTVWSGLGGELGGTGYRVLSSNHGVSWTVEESSEVPGELRQVAFTKVGASFKLAEAWLRVQGQTYPYALRYHREQ